VEGHHIGAEPIDGAKAMHVKNRHRISLSGGAQRAGLTPQGLLKILRRTGSAIRDDGRWYVDASVVDQIATARRVLGIDRTKKSKGGAKRSFVGSRRVGDPRRGNAEVLASNKPDGSPQPPKVVPGLEVPA
jgi:hypothetical protein